MRRIIIAALGWLALCGAASAQVDGVFSFNPGTSGKINLPSNTVGGSGGIGLLALGWGVGPGSIAIGSGGATYAVGDTITLACSGATFTTSPQITVNAVSGGVITGSTLTNSGSATVIPKGICTFTQSATSGSGTTATFTGTFGPIAANLSFASLGTGGGNTNGNFFLGSNTPNVAGIGGAENVFVGNYAGSGITGNSVANTAVGHNSGGNGGAGGSGNFNSFFGDDAGRNYAGGNNNSIFGQGAAQNVASDSNSIFGEAAGGAVSANGSNSLFGHVAGFKLSGADNSIFGAGAGSSATGGTGAGNALFGFNVGNALQTGSFNLMLGTSVGANTTTGSRNILIGTNGCPTAGVGTNDSFVICSSGAVQIFGSSNINTATPAWVMAGTLAITGMTQTSAAQSGTVCYNSGTGAVTYDATLGCLASTLEAKNDWLDMVPEQALAIVKQLRPGTYTYKLGLGLPDGPQVGFAAEQVAEIDPRLVGYRPDGTLGGVRYQQASALYAGAITALETRLEALEARVH